MLLSAWKYVDHGADSAVSNRHVIFWGVGVLHLVRKDDGTT